MNPQLLSLVKLILLLPLIIVLIYITFKYGGRYMNKMSSGRIIKIVERVPLSQTCILSVVIIDNKPYLISNGEKGAQILLELDPQVAEHYQKRGDLADKLPQGYLDLSSILGKRKGEK